MPATAAPSGTVASRPAVIALGSNIEPAVNLPQALDKLRQRLEVTAVSHVYETAPVGAEGVPTFLNAAIRAQTGLSPGELKWRVLRPIEAEMGRARGEDRNAPRTVDLDLVLLGAEVVSDPGRGIELPDPELLTRAHLALPVADVAGELPHPRTGEPLMEIARRFRGEPGVRRLGTDEIDWSPVGP